MLLPKPRTHEENSGGDTYFYDRDGITRCLQVSKLSQVRAVKACNFLHGSKEKGEPRNERELKCQPCRGLT